MLFQFCNRTAVEVASVCMCSEAARVCRRKKKEYIACLEMRVMVLESQNRALVHEFKSLRELYSQYTHKPDSQAWLLSTTIDWLTASLMLLQIICWSWNVRSISLSVVSRDRMVSLSDNLWAVFQFNLHRDYWLQNCMFDCTIWHCPDWLLFTRL